MNETTARPPAPLQSDLEVKDAQLIFSAVWDDLLQLHGRDNLRFPREFIWLGGAPGAGKGTNTPFIAKTRDISAPPIVISGLLTSPQAVAIKNAGKMVGDREVIGLLFEELLNPTYHQGVIIDGFPRTTVQVECLKMFYDKMVRLHGLYRTTPTARFFRRPLFRIALLFVGEDVSVQRQLKRGQEIRERNRQVRATGAGSLFEERPTDVDPDLCRSRYRTFKETTYDALDSLKQIFHFHFIDAEDDLEAVQKRILAEFTYQSSLELSAEVLDLIRNIPIASELTQHARKELIERIERYEEEDLAKFQQVVKLIENKMLPIVRAHAISGHARINTEDELLNDEKALRMLIDVLSERGYHAIVDIHKMAVPERINPDTWEIICATRKIFRIEIQYQASEIRRGH